MIKVSVLYPHADGCRFDMDYYCNKHIPMVNERVGTACTGITIDQGLAGENGEPPPFVAMAHLHFASVEAFLAAFGPHDAKIMADIPNYTDIAPVVQISRVVAEI